MKEVTRLTRGRSKGKAGQTDLPPNPPTSDDIWPWMLAFIRDLGGGARAMEIVGMFPTRMAADMAMQGAWRATPTRSFAIFEVAGRLTGRTSESDDELPF